MILAVVVLAAAAEAEPRLPAAEQEAVYAVLEAINPGFPWRASFPDDLCLAGPHGITCDADDGGDTSHVVALSLGYVSDFSANPRCDSSSSAAAANLLTSGLLAAASFPRLRTLFVYGCFVVAGDGGGGEVTRPWILPPTLQDLVLVNNPALTGRLDITGVDLPLLRRLVISTSGLSGDLPATAFPRLEQLVLSGSKFTGRISNTLVAGAGAGGVKILDLSSNRLAGGIPPVIGGLKSLIKLDLSGNNLAGAIPSELGRLTSLELLDLSHNRLTGGVPAAALGGMTAMREIYLSGNRRLGGRVPAAEMFAGMKGIAAVGLSDAGLTGSIPANLGESLRNVSYLGLDGNLIDGEVPPAMAKMTGRVRLHGNRGICVSPEFLAAAVASGSQVAGVPSCNATESNVTRRNVVLPVALASSAATATAAALMVGISYCVVVIVFLLVLC
uniref:Leucine-rich repeat-containing N-terminal plant-type domain-containing protein n=1 Tax=Leersia perrieri TaxID=77586 RepID=A0A0D9WSA8_9ORYZ